MPKDATGYTELLAQLNACMVEHFEDWLDGVDGNSFGSTRFGLIVVLALGSAVICYKCSYPHLPLQESACYSIYQTNQDIIEHNGEKCCLWCKEEIKADEALLKQHVDDLRYKKYKDLIDISDQ
jgi:hypothetical protein